MANDTRVGALGSQTRTALASKVLRFLKHPQLSGEVAQVRPSSDCSSFTIHLALPPPTSERGYDVLYATIHWLNNDILLNIFDYYRLDEENGWNVRLGWCKLFHVCQRWRHLIYEFTFHLGMHIHCTHSTPIVDTLDHLPPLPLFIDYRYSRVTILTEQDELGIYHALRLHDRVRHIDLDLPPSILHKCLVLLDGRFTILEHLSLWSTPEKITTFTLPKAFLAPNLRRLDIPPISPLRRLRFLSSTISLVTLVFWGINASTFFTPRLLVARLRSLSRLEELSIDFLIPIPRPSTEGELLGGQGAPVTLPNLKTLRFKGVSAYLESLVAQIRVPLLERLGITLFNQIAFALPHLFHLVNMTEGFKLPAARVHFDPDDVSITTAHHSSRWSAGRFFLRVKCKQLDWQIDCAAQICSALIPALSNVKRFSLDMFRTMPTEWQNIDNDGEMWHELLRSFIGARELHIDGAFLEELSRALHEVGSVPGFLPDLQYIVAANNPFASFIDTRRAMGRPVQFSPRPRQPQVQYTGRHP